MEPWITPKFFEEVNDGGDKIVDEYTYAQYLDPAVYKERMVGHWDTFYTFEDFEKFANAGLSHFRIPIAYWYWDVIEGEPFPEPNMDDTDEMSPLFYLKRGLQWMDYFGLQAVLDLHTGPGSQNGYDNSGKRGDIHWVDFDYPGKRDNIDRTLQIIEKFSNTAKQWINDGVISAETIYGIGVLNEPHACGGWNFNGEMWTACKDDFFPKAVEVVRKVFSPEEAVAIVDIAGHGYNEFGGVFADTNGVEVDAHNYQCFGGYWNDVAHWPDGWGTHLDVSCTIKDEIAECPLSTYLGEFSLAVTECQKYLSGGYMIEYIPPDNDPELCNYYNSDFSTYSDDYKEFLANFFLAQIDSFEHGNGWFFWTGKTD